MDHLIKPHGSDSLNPLFVADEAKRAELQKEAEGLPKLLVCSQAAANAVKDLLPASKGDAQPRLWLLEGEPELTIPQLVEKEHEDLVVMGTVARTGLAGALIGNTAEKILRRINCSLLAVKPDGFISPVRVEDE